MSYPASPAYPTSLDDRSSSHSWLRSGRIPSLDGIRGIAVLLVIVAHLASTHQFAGIRAFQTLGAFGQVGVDAFFVLSGFLITLLLLREMDRTRAISLRGFYMRRALRILPAYVSFLIFVAIADQIGMTQVSGKNWLTALTYTVNFDRHRAPFLGHVWSLSIEEHFYFLWPLIVCAFTMRGRAIVSASLVMLSFVVRMTVLIVWPQHANAAEWWTFSRFDPIAAGCLLAVLAWTPRGLAFLKRFVASRAGIIIAGLVFLVSLRLDLKYNAWGVGASHTVNALCIAVLMWAAATYSNSLPGRSLNGATISVIGVMSYSLYIWQQPFLCDGESWWQKFPANLPLLFIAAAVSFHFIEQPFLRLKDRMGRRRHASVTAPAPAPGPAVDDEDLAVA